MVNVFAVESGRGKSESCGISTSSTVGMGVSGNGQEIFHGQVTGMDQDSTRARTESEYPSVMSSVSLLIESVASLMPRVRRLLRPLWKCCCPWRAADATSAEESSRMNDRIVLYV